MNITTLCITLLLLANTAVLWLGLLMASWSSSNPPLSLPDLSLPASAYSKDLRNTSPKKTSIATKNMPTVVVTDSQTLTWRTFVMRTITSIKMVLYAHSVQGSSKAKALVKVGSNHRPNHSNRPSIPRRWNNWLMKLLGTAHWLLLHPQSLLHLWLWIKRRHRRR